MVYYVFLIGNFIYKDLYGFLGYFNVVLYIELLIQGENIYIRCMLPYSVLLLYDITYIIIGLQNFQKIKPVKAANFGE